MAYLYVIVLNQSTTYQYINQYENNGKFVLSHSHLNNPQVSQKRFLFRKTYRHKRQLTCCDKLTLNINLDNICSKSGDFFQFAHG